MTPLARSLFFTKKWDSAEGYYTNQHPNETKTHCNRFYSVRPFQRAINHPDWTYRSLVMPLTAKKPAETLRKLAEIRGLPQISPRGHPRTSPAGRRAGPGGSQAQAPTSRARWYTSEGCNALDSQTTIPFYHFFVCSCRFPPTLVAHYSKLHFRLYL